MRNRRDHRASKIEGLRLAVDCMPVATREAMLTGLRSNERILVGAYTDGQGGVCPMLAAHRAGGRTDFISFAKSWDRFARTRGKSRAATEREVRMLIAQLRASIETTDGLELDRAIAEHRSLLAAAVRRRANRRLGDQHDPAGEIRARRLTRPRSRSRALLPA